MDKRYFIIAGSYAQVMDFVHKREIHLRDIEYITDPRQLLNREGKGQYFYIYGSARQQPLYTETIRMAKNRNFVITYCT